MSQKLKFLIEAATGVFTGSVYSRDETLYQAGFLGEESWEFDGRTAVQKTHHRSLLDSEYEKYDLTWRQSIIDLVDGRGVLLLRNPYKVSQENAALYDDR